MEQFSFREQCQQYLTERWTHIIQLFEGEEIREPLADDLKLKEKIRDCLTSNIKSYLIV